MFAVKSYKLSRLHLLLISGGDKLPWLMRCLFQLYASCNRFGLTRKPLFNS